MTTETTVLTFELRHKLARSLEMAGISKEQMAAELGVTRKTIDNYISGRTEPTRGYLRLWADVTGIPRSELVEDDPGTHPVNSRQALAYVA